MQNQIVDTVNDVVDLVNSIEKEVDVQSAKQKNMETAMEEQVARFDALASKMLRTIQEQKEVIDTLKLDLNASIQYNQRQFSLVQDAFQKLHAQLNTELTDA